MSEVYVLERASYEDDDTVYPDCPVAFASQEAAQAVFDAWLADHGMLETRGGSYDMVAHWSAELYRCPLDGGEATLVWHRTGVVPESWIDEWDAAWDLKEALG